MFPETSQTAWLYALSEKELLAVQKNTSKTQYQRRTALKILIARMQLDWITLVPTPPSKAQIRSRLLGQVRFHTRGMIGLIDNFSRNLKALYDTDADKFLVDVLMERIAYARAELTLVDIVGCEISTIAIVKRKATEIVLKSGTIKQEKSS